MLDLELLAATFGRVLSSHRSLRARSRRPTPLTGKSKRSDQEVESLLGRRFAMRQERSRSPDIVVAAIGAPQFSMTVSHRPVVAADDPPLELATRGSAAGGELVSQVDSPVPQILVRILGRQGH